MGAKLRAWQSSETLALMYLPLEMPSSHPRGRRAQLKSSSSDESRRAGQFHNGFSLLGGSIKLGAHFV